MKAIEQILKDSKTVAVVGMSNKPDRASNEVAHYLQQHGYKVIPVNPTYAGQEILGEKVYASLQDAAAGLPECRIDVVDCFRKPDDMLQVTLDAIAIGAGCLWMQLGVVNQEAADLASSAGLEVVMDHCMKIEHAALGV